MGIDWAYKVWADLTPTAIIGSLVTAAIVGLLTKFGKKVWEWIQSLSRKSANWVSTLPRRIYAALGLVTKADLQALSMSGSPQQLAPSGPQRIVRMGLRFDLSPSIDKKIGRVDPSVVSEDWVDAVIQGPFCLNCHHTLANRGAYEGAFNHFKTACQVCNWVWERNPDKTKTRYPLIQIKLMIYKSLDAEMRRTSEIQPDEVVAKPGSLQSDAPAAMS